MSGGAASAQRVYAYSLPVDIAVTASGHRRLAHVGFAEEPARAVDCRWCESNALDTAVRDHLRWTAHGGTAVTLSNAGAYVVAPLVGAGWLAVSAAQRGRRASGRGRSADHRRGGRAGRRPQSAGEVHGRAAAALRPRRRAQPRHAARAPTTRTSRSIRRTPASRSRSPPPPAPSLACAATAGRRSSTSRARAIGAATAYLRIAADQHYLTDVVTGAVVGTAWASACPFVSSSGGRRSTPRLVRWCAAVCSRRRWSSLVAAW